MKKIIIALLAACSALACSTPDTSELSDGKRQFTITAGIAETTRTVYDVDTQSAQWKRGDRIGVIASYNDGTMKFTDSSMQYFSITNSSAYSDYVDIASFGGSLTDTGAQTYTYYGVYPYTALKTLTDPSALSLFLPTTQYPDRQSWDSSCDVLVAQPVEAASAAVGGSGLDFRFAHVFGFLRLTFGETILTPYGNEEVETVSLTVDDGKKLAGEYLLDLTSTTGAACTMGANSSNTVTLDYRNNGYTLATLGAATFVLAPDTYETVTITIATEEHTITLVRGGLTVANGRMVNAPLSLKPTDATPTANTPLLPRMNQTETLRILCLGSSLGMDAFEYVPALAVAAGLNNVVCGRYYRSSCTIKHKYDGYTTSAYAYTKAGAGQSTLTSIGNKTVQDCVKDEAWDVIVVMGLDAGLKSDYSPALSRLIPLIKADCTNPNVVIGYQLVWSYGEASTHWFYPKYNNDNTTQFNAFVWNAKEMMKETGVKLIVLCGTAVENVRNSTLNNSPYELMRDGIHLDLGAGRYVAACTWFESIIEPVYGVSVLGNSYIPTSSTYLAVTQANKELLQKAAIAAAKHKFEVTRIEALPEPPRPLGDPKTASHDGFGIGSVCEW